MFTSKKIHMIGIGGISMSGIAEILLASNCMITGYDAVETEITKRLIEKGINVSYEANLKSVENADLIVYTAAMPQDFEEIAYAKKLGKELYERSVFFGLMMKDYKNVLCISGTHGKSTTSGMVCSIFMEAKKNPTIQIGAMLPLILGNNHVGSNEFFIAEACEYVDSFLDFFPTSEIILNIDADHLDYFKNLDNIINSFKRFTELLPNDGYLIINNDDENTKLATKDIENKVSFGINNEANFMAKNIEFDKFGNATYDLHINNEFRKKVKLNVSGIHNVYDSLAAIALSYQYINDLDIICKALENFHGVGRRFEYLGKYQNVDIYDDYAHHPNEIRTTLDSVKKKCQNESWAIFQSHTYSRTKNHLKEFAEVLSRFDHIIIAKIYPAREINTYNIHEDDLVKEIKKKNQNVIYLDTFEKIINYIKENTNKGDLVTTIGAGNIYEVAKKLVD